MGPFSDTPSLKVSLDRKILNVCYAHFSFLFLFLTMDTSRRFVFLHSKILHAHSKHIHLM